MNKFTALIIISFLISPLPTLAAGLQASPSSLDFSVSAGQDTSKSLVISNPTADVQIFELSADEYSELILPAPRSFTLESGARKIVVVTISNQGSLKHADEKITTNLSIVSKPLSQAGLAVGAGVKIPITINIAPSPKKNIPYALPAGIIIVILALAYLVHKEKRQP